MKKNARFLFARRWGMLTAALMLAASGQARADMLGDFLAEAEHLQLRFVQTVLRGDGAGGAREGQLWLRRPGKFRLEYEGAPPLVVVCDGKTLWSYEADLNQAVAAACDRQLGGGLAAALAGGDWRARFAVTQSVPQQGLIFVTAAARDDESGVREIRFVFSEGGELQSARFTDYFGGEASLQFKEISRARADDALFSFSPPDGVDVIRADGGG